MRRVSMQKDRNRLNTTFMRDKPLKFDVFIRLLKVCWISSAERGNKKLHGYLSHFRGFHTMPKRHLVSSTFKVLLKSFNHL